MANHKGTIIIKIFKILVFWSMVIFMVKILDFLLLTKRIQKDMTMKKAEKGCFPLPEKVPPHSAEHPLHRFAGKKNQRCRRTSTRSSKQKKKKEMSKLFKINLVVCQVTMVCCLVASCSCLQP